MQVKEIYSSASDFVPGSKGTVFLLPGERLSSSGYRQSVIRTSGLRQDLPGGGLQFIKFVFLRDWLSLHNRDLCLFVNQLIISSKKIKSDSGVGVAAVNVTLTMAVTLYYNINIDETGSAFLETVL